MFQKLHAVHNFPLVSSQSGGVSTSTLPSPSSQAKIITQTPQSGGAVMVAGGEGGAVAGGSTQAVLQSSFPQGSILVVPHPTSPFHAVLPVFANTAVIMPPGGGGASAITGSTSSSTLPLAVASSQAAGSSTAMAQAIIASGAAAGISPQQAITIDGRLLGMGGATIPGSGPESNQMIQLVQQAMASAGVTSAFIQPSLDTSQQDSTDKEKPVAVIQQPSSMQYKDYQKYVALASLSMPHPVYTMTVEEAVELVKINFESKSIEITGEVPITKIDTETISPEKLNTMMRDSREGAELKAGPDAGRATEKTGEGESAAVMAEPVKEGMIEVEEKTDTVNVVEISQAGTSAAGEGKNDANKDKNINSGVVAAEETVGGDSFRGHSTADILSAELLLSLTGNSSKNWPASSPVKSSPLKSSSVWNDSSALTSSPGTSGPHTPSGGGGRKRKQKPIASAKPAAAAAAAAATSEATSEGSKDSGTPANVKKRSRARKRKKDEAAGEDEPEEPAKQAEQKGGTKSKQFTPEELLEILNIPPSSKPSGAGKGPGKGRGKPEKDTDLEPISMSKASVKMEELKASRIVKPMKEYIIETDSDSNSSSSSSSSSKFSPNSGSSSDSSSDSSSNDDSSEPKVKTPIKKAPAARGRGRGRGKGQKLAERVGYHSSSSDDSSSEDDEEEEERSSPDKKQRKGAAPVRRGGRGGKRGVAMRGRGSHVVSIPTRLLKNKIKQKKRVKPIGNEVRRLNCQVISGYGLLTTWCDSEEVCLSLY